MLKFFSNNQLLRVRSDLLICVITLAQQITAPQWANATDCSTFLTPEQFFAQRRVGVTKQGTLEFSAEARKHFADTRKQLRAYTAALRARIVESEAAIHPTQIAQAIQGNSLIFGSAGANKTVLSRQAVFVPIPQPGAPARSEAFAILFHQLQGDSLLRGWLDPAELKNAIITPQDVHTQGSMLHARYALGDEVDKANPQVIGALNDFMDPEKRIAQFGPITLKSRLEFVVLTSNLTPGELIQQARPSGSEQDMRAILNRVPFKIWMPNSVIKDQSRVRLLQLGDEQSTQWADRILSAPEERFQSQFAQAEEYHSDLPYVDFAFLGGIALRGLKASDGFKSFAAKLFDNYHLKSAQNALEDESVSFQNLLSGQSHSAQVPTSQQSNRDLKLYILQTIKASLLLDLMLVDEAKLPNDILLQFLSRGWELEDFSAWRMQWTLLTTAPFSQIPKWTHHGSKEKLPILHFDTSTDAAAGPYLRYADTAREVSRLQGLIREQKLFQSEYNALLESKLQEVGHTATALEDFQQKVKSKIQSLLLQKTPPPPEALLHELTLSKKDP